MPADWIPLLLMADACLPRTALLALAAASALARRAARPGGFPLAARASGNPARRYLPCHRASAGFRRVPGAGLLFS